jgi:uncharacterized protein YhjY with autotransporter beta-barrel domain
MTDTRVTSTDRGGSRRHDDPPAWLDKSLPYQKRKDLLDQAIRELAHGPQQQQAQAQPTPHPGGERRKKSP